MLNDELRGGLSEAKSLEETKKILAGHEGLDAERIDQEIENKRSAKANYSICKNSLPSVAVSEPAIGKRMAAPRCASLPVGVEATIFVRYSM